MRKTFLFLFPLALVVGLWSASCTDTTRAELPYRVAEDNTPQLPDLRSQDLRIPGDLAAPADQASATDGPADASQADGGG